MELWSQAVSTLVTNVHGAGVRPAPEDAIGTPASADAGVQRGYADALRVAPSSLARVVVRAVGVGSALRLAPRLILDVRGVIPTTGGPGSVRVRYSGETSARRECLERQGAIVALPMRFGLEPFVLHDVSCVTRGDASCEYVLHHRDPPRWALITTATIVALALGWATRLTPAFILVLGALTATVSFVIERLRSARAERATRRASSRAFQHLVEGMRSIDVGAPAELLATRTSDQTPTLEQEGDVWRITYQGTTIRVRHSRGVALLSHLLQNPGEELHVQALDALVPSAGAAVDRPPVNAHALPIDGMSLGLGDAGPVIDDRARADYRRRLAELRAELEDAERCNDPGRAATARAEMEQIGDELRAATGLGGRPRRASSDADRMRIAVTRRIRAAIEQLSKLHPALGEHLDTSVRTGFTCCYSPVDRVRPA
jgi:hypothetical protein